MRERKWSVEVNIIQEDMKLFNNAPYSGRDPQLRTRHASPSTGNPRSNFSMSAGPRSTSALSTTFTRGDLPALLE